MKFGGTSMGSADRIRVAADIISGERKSRPLAVVVSAMSKVTDLLLETLRHAEVGDQIAVTKASKPCNRVTSKPPNNSSAKTLPPTPPPLKTSKISLPNTSASPKEY